MTRYRPFDYVTWLGLVAVVVAMVANLANLVRHVLDVPHAPVTAPLWAAFSVACLVLTIHSWGQLVAVECHRRAERSGPPQVFLTDDRGLPYRQLLVLVQGVDSQGRPAWGVDPIEDVPTGLVVWGLTRGAVIYVPAGERIIRLTTRGGLETHSRITGGP